MSDLWMTRQRHDGRTAVQQHCLKIWVNQNQTLH